MSLRHFSFLLYFVISSAYAANEVDKLIATFSKNNNAELPFVDNYEVCNGQKKILSTEEIRTLKRSGRFPLAGFTLDKFVNNYKKLDSFQKNKGVLCSKYEGDFSKKLPEKIELVLGKLGAEAHKALQTESAKQKAFLKKGLDCVKLTLADSQTASNCKAYAEKLLKNIQDRYDLMRLELGIAMGDISKRERLQHDTALSTEIWTNFLPDFSNPNIKELAPLSDSEYKIVLDRVVNENASAKDAWQNYYRILSANPILLHFRNKPQMSDLYMALKKIEAQMEKDLKTDSKIPQDILLITPVAAQALKNMSPEDLPLACNVLNEIYKNIIIEDIIAPRNNATFALVIAASMTGLGSGVVKAFAQGAIMAFGVSTGIAPGVQKYAQGIASCASRVASKEVTSDLYGDYCDYSIVTERNELIKSNARSEILFGLELFGLSRIAVRLLN